MTKLKSAINYFLKTNEKGINGTVEKIFAYEIAETACKNINDIFDVYTEFNERLKSGNKMTEKEALDKIYWIIITK